MRGEESPRDVPLLPRTLLKIINSILRAITRLPLCVFFHDGRLPIHRYSRLGTAQRVLQHPTLDT